MAMDAMMAGVDTTGGAATFLLYHLASNEEKQELLYKEICDIIGPSTSDIITESKIKKMKYLRACAQESHRLRCPWCSLTIMCPKESVSSILPSSPLAAPLSMMTPWCTDQRGG